MWPGDIGEKDKKMKGTRSFRGPSGHHVGAEWSRHVPAFAYLFGVPAHETGRGRAKITAYLANRGPTCSRGGCVGRVVVSVRWLCMPRGVERVRNKKNKNKNKNKEGNTCAFACVARANVGLECGGSRGLPFVRGERLATRRPAFVCPIRSCE